MKYQIVRTTQKHIDELATTMRQVDIDEVWASNHLSPKASLNGSYSMTPDTYTGLVDDQVMCVFGKIPRSVKGIGSRFLIKRRPLEFQEGGIVT